MQGRIKCRIDLATVRHIAEPALYNQHDCQNLSTAKGVNGAEYPDSATAVIHPSIDVF